MSPWWCVVSVVYTSAVLAQTGGLDDLFDGPPLHGDLDKISGFWYQIAEFETDKRASISCSDIVLRGNHIIHLDQICQETSKHKIIKIEGDKFEIHENGHIIQFKTSLDSSVLGIYRKTTTDFTDSIKVYGRNLNKTEYFNQLEKRFNIFSSKTCKRQKLSDCLLKIKKESYQHVRNHTSHKIKKRLRREQNERNSEQKKSNNHTVLFEYGDYTDGVTIQKINNTQYIVYDDVFMPLESNDEKADEVAKKGDPSHAEENSKCQINHSSVKELADDPNSPSITQERLSDTESHSSNGSMNLVENFVLANKIDTLPPNNDIYNVTPSTNQYQDYKLPADSYSPSTDYYTYNLTNIDNLPYNYTNIFSSVIGLDPLISNSELPYENQTVDDLNCTSFEKPLNLTTPDIHNEEATIYLNESNLAITYVNSNITSGNFGGEANDEDIKNNSSTDTIISQITAPTENNVSSSLTTVSSSLTTPTDELLVTEVHKQNNLSTPTSNTSNDNYNPNLTFLNTTSTQATTYSANMDNSQENITHLLNNLSNYTELDTENITVTDSFSRIVTLTSHSIVNFTETPKELNVTTSAVPYVTSLGYNTTSTTVSNNTPLDGGNFTHSKIFNNSTFEYESEVTTKQELETNNTIVITDIPHNINNTYVTQHSFSTEMHASVPIINDNRTSIHTLPSISSITTFSYNDTTMPTITENDHISITNEASDNSTSSVITKIPQMSTFSGTQNITDYTLNVTETPINNNTSTLTNEDKVTSVFNSTKFPLNVTIPNRFSSIMTDRTTFRPSTNASKHGNANRVVPNWTIFVSLTAIIFYRTKVSYV